MPNWKKIITSGSNASLNTIFVEDDINISGSVHINAIPASDHEASGITTTLEMGGAFSQFSLIYPKTGIGGPFARADADSATTMPAIGMLLESSSAGAQHKKVLLQGFVRDDSWAWTPGDILYVSSTAGTLTSTTPSGTGDQVQIVGIATHADRIYFKPELTTVEIA